MIGHTADAVGFRDCIAADGCKIGVHARSHVGVQPRVAVSCAEDKMKNNFAKRLRHGRTIAEEVFRMNRAFSANFCAHLFLGRCPRLL